VDQSGGGMTQVIDFDYYSVHFCGLKPNNMSTTISNAQGVPAYTPAAGHPSLIERFLDWATKEDVKHHIGWVGLSIIVMTAVFFPITMAAILFNGASFGLIVASMVPLVLVFVTNLAALPTRYTIPSLFVGVLAELIIMVISFWAR
jgi:hypothetical protein